MFVEINLPVEKYEKNNKMTVGNVPERKEMIH